MNTKIIKKTFKVYMYIVLEEAVNSKLEMSNISRPIAMDSAHP